MGRHRFIVLQRFAGGVMQLPGASGQCGTCRHWQRRGGTLLPATMGCRAFEQEQPGRTAALLAAIAVERASCGGCPVCEPLPNEPGSFLAQDLPLAPAAYFTDTEKLP